MSKQLSDCDLEWLRETYWPETCSLPQDTKQGDISAVINSASNRVQDNEVEQRAIAYLNACPPAISGQNGHAKAFEVAQALVNGFQLDGQTAFRLLSQHYNHRCEPEWSERELRHKVSEACQNPCDKPRGWLLNDDIPNYSKGDIERLIKNSRGSVINEKPMTPEKSPYRILSAAELEAGNYLLTYLVQNILVAGQPCIMAGDKKTLKTTLLLALMIALATGQPFLGTLRVYRAVRVCIMTGESGLGTIQETCRRICKAMGLSLADIDGLMFSEDLPKLGISSYLISLFHLIKENAIKLLAIDPAYLCMSGTDSGNLFKQGELLRGVSEVCRKAGCTLILCHHTRKNKGYGQTYDKFAPPELEDIAWAGFQEFARQWLLVGRRERYEPGTGKHRLWLSVGGSAGHSNIWALDVDEGTRDDVEGRKWDVSLKAVNDARKEAKNYKEEAKEAKRLSQLEDDMRAICNVMVAFPNGETKTAIRESSPLNPRRFNPAFAELISNRDIVLCNVVKSNRKSPYKGFKLAEDAHP